MQRGQLTSDDSDAVDNANSPKLVNHFQRNSKQQLKYQVSYDVTIPTTTGAYDVTIPTTTGANYTALHFIAESQTVHILNPSKHQGF